MRQVCGLGTRSAGKKEERGVVSTAGSFCRLMISEFKKTYREEDTQGSSSSRESRRVGQGG